MIIDLIDLIYLILMFITIRSSLREKWTDVLIAWIMTWYEKWTTDDRTYGESYSHRAQSPSPVAYNVSQHIVDELDWWIILCHLSEEHQPQSPQFRLKISHDLGHTTILSH